MVFSIITYLLAALGVVGIALVASGGLDRIGRIPDQIEIRGPFELVTHTGHRDEYYSIRHRGKPFTFQGRAGEYDESMMTYRYVNSLITFDNAPAAVAHVGDPNNTGFFYLIHEVDGAARADYLAESRAGVSANWLDGRDSGGTRAIALHRGQLEGGRWLLLGDQCVLDTQTLRSHRFEPIQNYFFSPFKAPLGISPDQRSFIRLASASGDTEYLVVIRFADGNSYTLPIDRSTMRFETIEDLDAEWVQHHFEWTPGTDGDELAVRAEFIPLPYLGSLTTDRSSGYREYRLPRSSPALFDTLVGFAIRELGATRDGESNDPSSADLRIGEDPLHIAYYTDHATVYAPHGARSKAVLLFARAFDDVLKSGRHDQLFGESSRKSDPSDAAQGTPSEQETPSQTTEEDDGAQTP
jgi:hypothetical protein